MPIYSHLYIINFCSKIQMELGLTVATQAIKCLGEFDYQGNPQICFIVNYQAVQPILTDNTSAHTTQWVSFNELERALDYLPALVDSFFEQFLVAQ